MLVLQQDQAWQKIHPLIVVCLLFSHIVIAFLWDLHPLIVGGQFLFLICWVMKEGYLPRLYPIFRMGIWFSLFFLVINPLCASNGITYLWKGPVTPLIGRLDVTAEEAIYSLLGVVRLFNLLIVSVMFQRYVDHDRFMFLFAKRAPRFVIASVMAFRLFPFLRQEYTRIKEIAYLRGIEPKTGGLKEKLSASLFILRPLLTSALEGSWYTAETLYARGFGSGPRTSFRPKNMQSKEKIGLFLVLISLMVAIFARMLDFGRMQYFPQLSWIDPIGDLLLVAALIIVWVVPIWWLNRRGDEYDYM